MKIQVVATLVASTVVLAACTTTEQQATVDFKPPEGNYRLVVMRPDITVSLLTAGGQLEPREDWTNQARGHVVAALKEQQAKRGGQAVIASTAAEAGADPQVVAQLDRLHEAVGRSIRLHKYTPAFALPTKKNSFDWTLGQLAVDYGKASGYDYAMFLHAEDSFSSGGRVALQAVSMLGCVVGVCYIPLGGQQVAFASLVDLKTGNVVWFNFLVSAAGDIREPEGARQLVDNLLDKMQAPEKSG
jgi:hypothetical protein